MPLKIYRRPAFELLKDRQVMAGNLAVVLSGSTLTLTGDQQSNTIKVSRFSSTQVHLEDPTNTTTFNGQLGAIDVNFFVDGNLRVRMNDGDDKLYLSNNANELTMKTLSV